MRGLTDRMRWIPEGTFQMGSEELYPEERPVHRVSLDGFWMDEHPVTAADFRRFVREGATSPSASAHSIPPTFPAPTRSRSSPARSSSARPPGRSTYGTSATGGPLRLRVPLATEPADRVSRMAAPVHRLPVPGLHQRDRLQPDRRDAACALGQDRDGSAVARLARRPRARHRTRR